MKKLITLIALLLLINSANAQVGVAINNYTSTCDFIVRITAHDATNTACNYYSSVAFSAPSGVTFLSWATLNNALLWGPSLPDFNTIVIDGYCIDFDASTGCNGNSACVGDPTCGFTGINGTLPGTCSCNNFKPVLIGYNQTYYGPDLYWHCKIGQ